MNDLLECNVNYFTLPQVPTGCNGNARHLVLLHRRGRHPLMMKQAKSSSVFTLDTSVKHDIYLTVINVLIVCSIEKPQLCCYTSGDSTKENKHEHTFQFITARQFISL